MSRSTVLNFIRENDDARMRIYCVYAEEKLVLYQDILTYSENIIIFLGRF